MENILVIRLKAIGDVIFTLPAIGVLREHFPAAKITFLTSKENSSLLRGFREVNEVIALDRAALRSGNLLKMGAEFLGLLRRLRAGKFSLVVDFQGFGETAWLSRLTGAPQRWGSIYGSGRSWAYTQRHVRDNSLHLAEWDLQLLRNCGLSSRTITNVFSLPPDAIDAARKFYLDNSLNPSQPTLVFHPFTSTPQKNWPLENFIKVADYWRTAGVQAIFAGSPKDDPSLVPARAAGFCVATGLPLLVSAGLAELATLTLSGDSGLGHMAVAQGRRVIMLIMYKHSGACVPFQHPDWAIFPERPGHLEEVSVETVLAETGRVLNRP